MYISELLQRNGFTGGVQFMREHAPKFKHLAPRGLLRVTGVVRPECPPTKRHGAGV